MDPLSTFQNLDFSALEMTKDFSSPNEAKVCVAAPVAPVMPPVADQTSYFGNPFPFAFYGLGERSQMFSTTFDNIQPQVYPGAHRWGTGADYDAKSWMDGSLYPMPFPIPQTMEPYPVDPCPSTVPSTSVAPTTNTLEYKQVEFCHKPLDYVMSRNPMNTYYNNVLPYADFTSTQALTVNWKSAAKGVNKPGIPPPKHRTGPGTNNVRVRTQDTYRVVYTDAQRTELELEYQSQQFITAERKAELSGRLNLTERQVKIWFQNRRAKDRREKRNKP